MHLEQDKKVVKVPPHASSVNRRSRGSHQPLDVEPGLRDDDDYMMRDLEDFHQDETEDVKGRSSSSRHGRKRGPNNFNAPVTLYPPFPHVSLLSDSDKRGVMEPLFTICDDSEMLLSSTSDSEKSTQGE